MNEWAASEHFCEKAIGRVMQCFSSVIPNTFLIDMQMQ